MTIENTAIKTVVQGNGATTVFAYTFLIPAQDDLVLTLVNNSSGNETVIPPASYTVTGLGLDVGGTVTYPLSGSPIASGFSLVIERQMPLTQETDLQNQGAVYPVDIEDALDNLTMIAQQLQDQIDRAIVFSIADTVETTLPVATARANKFLGFNSSGAPVAVDGLTAGTTVSAAMIPVVTAPTTAAALTALGLPGALLDLLIPAGTIWPYVGGSVAPTGFVFPFGQACTGIYPVLRAALVALGSPFGTNGVDPLLPDGRSRDLTGKSNMGGVDNGLLTGGTVLGAVLGTQSRTLVLANLPPYTPAGTIITTLVNSKNTSSTAGGAVNQLVAGSANDSGAALALSGLTATSAFTGTAQGGTSTAFGIVDPKLIVNYIIKVH